MIADKCRIRVDVEFESESGKKKLWIEKYPDGGPKGVYSFQVFQVKNKIKATSW